MTVTEKAMQDIVHELRQLNKTMIEIGSMMKERNDRFGKSKKNEERRDTTSTEV